LAADLAQRYGNVLVVASEIMSRRISDADPDTAILFGDGAGACLVSRASGASRKIPRAIADLLAKHGKLPDDVGVFLMHQANLNLIRKVASVLKVPEERFFVDIDRYGNTSSASLLIAAAEWRRATPEVKTPIVLATFGAGFSWGAVLAVPV
jgi:3-oxoacyl-[acyl-carrier-protein] synthase-3